MFKKILSLGLAIVMTLTMGTSAFASENNQTSSEVTTIEDVYELETFVIREEDGTLSLDTQAALDNNGNPEAVEALQQHFSTINPQILDGQISTDDELNIIGGEHIISSHRCSLGSNSFTTFWWGYQRYACNCESERIVSDLNTWAAGGTMAGGAAAGVAIIFPVTAPVAGVIAAGAAFDTGYWWLLATRIDANNEGRGTITNMTHVLVFDIMPQ
ncbi:MAG: hypothetical protein R3Y67_02895 [Eubacteriales bacterium]